MVSKRAIRGDTRARIVAAAAEEFARCGFDGAKVDRIAARAAVNKAMLYYHFANKAALYRDILRTMFATVAAAVDSLRESGASPQAQLAAFIAAVNDTALTHPHFPPMWLREIADGGRHLDDAIVREMSSVVSTLAGILSLGAQRGDFRPVHPFIVQLGIVGPLLLFAASAPIRERYRDRTPQQIGSIPREAVVAQVQSMTLAGLRPEPAHPVRRRR